MITGFEVVGAIGFAIGALGFLVGTLEKGVGSFHAAKHYALILSAFHARLESLRWRLQLWHSHWLTIDAENSLTISSSVERLDHLWGSRRRQHILAIRETIKAVAQEVTDVLKHPQADSNSDDREWQSYLTTIDTRSNTSLPPIRRRYNENVLERIAVALWKRGLLEEKITRLKDLVDELEQQSHMAYWEARGDSDTDSSRKVSAEDIKRFDLIQDRATRLWLLRGPQSATWALLLDCGEMPDKPYELLLDDNDYLRLCFLCCQAFQNDVTGRHLTINYHLDLDDEEKFASNFQEVHAYDSPAHWSNVDGSITEALKMILFMISETPVTKQPECRARVQHDYARAALCVSS